MRKHLFSLQFIICCCISYAQTVPSYVPLTNLLAWYPFTGNAIDSSGRGNNGTVLGATLTSDRFGNPNHAYLFDGSSSKISTSFLPPIGDSARTITCWFKYNSLPNLCGDKGLCIVGYGGDNRGCFEACKNFSLEVSFTSYPPRADVDGICIAPYVSNTDDSVDGGWHFYAAVYDPSYGDFRNVKLYLDGTFDTTNTEIYGGTTVVRTDTLSKLQIGAGHYDCQRFFAGKIDDIGVWSRALSACELYELYHSVDTCITATALGSQVVKSIVPNQISMFPNPATDELTISVTNEIISIVIYNFIGQTVYTRDFNTKQVQIDVSALPAGVYFVKINGTEVRKFVKQ